MVTGSSTTTALGGVSAGGVGTPELDVTQVVLAQPGGSAGGITLSKFSARRVTGSHADASSPDEPARLLAPKEASAVSAATAAETKKRKQRTYRNGNAANLLF